MTIKTETDTEVLAHLISINYDTCLTTAVQKALAQVDGTYGIAVISAKHPGLIVAARMGSPLVVGCGEDENFIASDVSAMLEHTNKVIYLDDGDHNALTEIPNDGTTSPMRDYFTLLIVP